MSEPRRQMLFNVEDSGSPRSERGKIVWWWQRLSLLAVKS